MRCFILHAVLVVAGDCVRAQSVIPPVDIKSVDPTIVIELRYAGANILAGRALYPPGTPALVHPEVALPLVAARGISAALQIRTKILGCLSPSIRADAAMWHYRGADPAIRLHLHLLQTAMRDAGFDGQPIEWWQFRDSRLVKYLPRKEAERAT